MRAREFAAVFGGGITVLAAILGCGATNDVRVVEATGQGGELAIVGDKTKLGNQANAEMARICGGADRYRVIEEVDLHLVDGGAAMAYGPSDYRLRFACVTPNVDPTVKPITAR